MADWKKIRKQVGKAANKAIKKTEEIADIAVKQVKLAACESRLNKLYEKLGRLTYKQLKTGETQAQRISEVIPEIDSARVECARMRREIAEDKERRAKAKREAALNKNSDTAPVEDDTETAETEGEPSEDGDTF